MVEGKTNRRFVKPKKSGYPKRLMPHCFKRCIRINRNTRSKVLSSIFL
ncbi:hypothetical protein EV05_1136 [Prochlorococcus sp. MIT 0601]|nr:hypothetical protein EV05_1136 [Prochlorococcus sp. MIT 0601]